MGLKMSCCIRGNLDENEDNEISTQKRNFYDTNDIDKNQDFRNSQNTQKKKKKKKKK